MIVHRIAFGICPTDKGVTRNIKLRNRCTDFDQSGGKRRIIEGILICKVINRGSFGREVIIIGHLHSRFIIQADIVNAIRGYFCNRSA